MLGKIVAENGKVYNIYYLWSLNGDKYINLLKKEYPKIKDLIVSKDGNRYLCWPDPLAENWSFLKTLERGENMKILLEKRKTCIIGSEEVQEVNVLDSMWR